MNARTASETAPPTAADSWRMFDRIAGRYDLLNRLLSMRRDVAWRKLMCAHMPQRDAIRMLDLATGTGDVLLALAAGCSRVTSAVGLDRSGGMLSRAAEKVLRRTEGVPMMLVHGDAARIGCAAETFDVVSIAFGIRNVPDVPAALREMHRVLAPEGRALILEFSLPPNALVRWAYLQYFRHVLPRIGGLVSGDAAAYRYLNTSVEAFPYGEAFLALMREAGFENLHAIPLSLGIATLYIGDKPGRGAAA